MVTLMQSSKDRYDQNKGKMNLTEQHPRNMSHKIAEVRQRLHSCEANKSWFYLWLHSINLDFACVTWEAQSSCMPDIITWRSGRMGNNFFSHWI